MEMKIGLFPGDVRFSELPVVEWGFSILGTVFGINVKGGLQLIKKSWMIKNTLDNIKSLNVIDFN